MKILKVTVSSHELLSLEKKKEYIDTMYGDFASYGKKENIGFIHKFNNAIGFKPVTYPNLIKNSEGYVPPVRMLYENMRTPVDSFDILTFYIPQVKIIHPEKRFCYNSRKMTFKWYYFLKKIFPNLNITMDVVEEIPKRDLRDFALEFFYKNIAWDISYTIEFSSERMLTKKEIDYILPKIQMLSKEKIAIGQQECDTCKEYSNGERPYHIEIVYLSRGGKIKTIEQLIDIYGEEVVKNFNL